MVPPSPGVAFARALIAVLVPLVGFAVLSREPARPVAAQVRTVAAVDRDPVEPRRARAQRVTRAAPSVAATAVLREPAETPHTHAPEPAAVLEPAPVPHTHPPRPAAPREPEPAPHTHAPKPAPARELARVAPPAASATPAARPTQAPPAQHSDEGDASWHDHPHAEGYTAAHRTLPFGTVVTVTNVATGGAVEVTINDRGPFVEGRVIDLSREAFAALADPAAGVLRVGITW
jgi:rare lipoprotein A